MSCNPTKSLSASLRITSVYLRVALIGRYENSFLIAALHMICQSMVSTDNASRKNFLYWTTQVLHQRWRLLIRWVGLKGSKTCWRNTWMVPIPTTLEKTQFLSHKIQPVSIQCPRRLISQFVSDEVWMLEKKSNFLIGWWDAVDIFIKFLSTFYKISA